MIIVTVSSKGQMVLPAELRARLGFGPGAKLELSEVPGGLRLALLRPVRKSEVEAVAGMVKAPSKGRKRSLKRFGAAGVLRRKKQ